MSSENKQVVRKLFNDLLNKGNLAGNSTPCEQNSEPKIARLRCAIDTRKSTEGGLEQPFNTLEVQREAAERIFSASVTQVGPFWTNIR